ncbi:MAG TPA: hypothetical protein VFD70_21950 [Anaerolineae bacterium]|nr:hypothetical protein [Anaerolineae bacterium]
MSSTLTRSVTPSLHRAIANAAVEPDHTLIVQVQQLNRAALEILYDRYAAKGAELAFRILQDQTLAEQVTVRAFWWIWRFALEFPSTESDFSDWFFRIVRRLVSEELSQREL